MEQRNGRIDRHGQKSPEVYIWHFVYANNEDSKFLQTVVDKVETMRQELGSVGDVIASEIENTMLGLSNRRELKIDSLTEQIQKTKTDIHYSKINNNRIIELRNNLVRSRFDLEITHENLLALLNEGLKLVNHPGLKPVENNDLKNKGYILANMPNAWIDLEHTIRDSKGNLKTIIFDSNVGLSRNDTVLLHLNHPLMKRVINEFRKNIWAEEFHEDLRLFKSSYKILSPFILKYPGIVIFVRILANSKNNQKIHESIQTFGAEINKDQLIWLDDKIVQSWLKTQGSFSDIPIHIGNFLRKNFPSFEIQIKEKIIELQKNETLRIKDLLKEYVRKEIINVKSLITERIKEITARISNVTDSQKKITDYTEEENQQLQEDLKWLRKRKLGLEEQFYTEPEKIKLKFDLSKEIRVFPLGILYLLPDNLLKE
ncbi:MAG: hypothetical protein P0116_15895 [Candidatus Nitrosocosmicus sp.]|nr:hypothetical protein [Candidatus Nitrosocosmicus sp.]